MDIGKALSDKKMEIAIAVTAMALVLLWIAPYGYVTLNAPFAQPGIGVEGFRALIFVTTFAMLFYGLGYVQKEKSKESIKFLVYSENSLPREELRQSAMLPGQARSIFKPCEPSLDYRMVKIVGGDSGGG